MSRANFYRRGTCRLCDGADLTSVLTLTPTPPANAFVAADALDQLQAVFPLEVYFCESCTHVQLLDVVDPEILFADYVYVSGTSPVFVKHFADYAASVLSRFDSDMNERLVIDIGSNDGTLLKQFAGHGLAVLGIDPAAEIAGAATADGIETMPIFFTSSLAECIRAERGQAAIVTANNVFAHADSLTEIAEGVKTLLADDGLFVFEVSYLVDVFEKTLFDTIYHEHLAYHSLTPLIRFFAQHGMQLIDAERIESHGGSLRGTVQLAGGPRPVAHSVNGLVELESELGLNRAFTLKAYGDQINVVKDELKTCLRALKADGKSIAGFGAPAKATTLMYHFGIGPDIIDFIVDDSPLKQGLYSPGMHIPVLPSAAIYSSKPDALVVLAWNFADSIMRNHQFFVDQGGTFIVPLPKVEIFHS